MDEKILKHIAEHRLSSCMNNTKWKEIIREISSIDHYDPLVNIKLIFEQENKNVFSPVWWNEVEREGFELIEWLQINPIKTEKVGRGMVPIKRDFSKAIETALNKHHIPFEYENAVFTIHGYK